MTAAPGIVFDGEGDAWFFAYGSLMWDPCFPHVERHPALLRGFHRAFCVRSRGYRGSPEAPGLVLGLDRGGACRGYAFRIAARDRAVAAARIAEREMDRDIYRCRKLPVAIPAGRIAAHALVVRRESDLYVGRLPPGEAARRITRAAGSRGTNLAYLRDTVAHLDALGIREGAMHALLREAERLAETGNAGSQAPWGRGSNP
jgi:cation transport protein ChaC